MPTGLPVTINGCSHHLRAGITVLEALHQVGIKVPDLCYDPRISPSGNCRLRLVEIETRERPLAACQTLLSEGMRIWTHTPPLEAGRKTILKMLARRYPQEALAKWPDKPFHQWLRHYGVMAGAPEKPVSVDDSHPYIRVDMSRCIDCTRCVRICAQVQGQFVWGMRNRGDETAIIAAIPAYLWAQAPASVAEHVQTRAPQGH